MLAKFTAHPASVNETYFQHMRVALSFSLLFFMGGLAAFVHAFFPFLFEKTGSTLIDRLNQKILSQRGK